MSRPTPRASKLLGLLEAFEGLRIGVLGDLIADRYTYGRPVRLSREAPVMIIREEREEIIPGGAANTVANLRALGARVLPVGLLGDDPLGEQLLAKMLHAGVDARGVRVLRDYRTVAKTRVLAGDVHTVKQQVVRIDREVSRSLTGKEAAGVVGALESLGEGMDAWLVSDYGYHAASPQAVEWVRGHARGRGGGVPIVADSRHRLRELHGFTVVTPNEGELSDALSLADAREETVLAGGEALRRELGGEAVLVTRGNRGMILFEEGEEPLDIPIHGSAEILDVSGAGDTVASVLTLALAAGASLVDACRLANVASGLTVMKRGAATVTPREIACAL